MGDRELNDAYGLIADIKADKKRLQGQIEALEQRALRAETACRIYGLAIESTVNTAGENASGRSK